MNIFERIQHGTGLENYCTDILVGILQKDPILLRNFCIDVLGIPKDSLPNLLKIIPQAHYKGIDEKNKEKSYVDIEISGIDFLCFLEMKVESTQNHGQIEKYNDVLLGEKSKNRYLRFCTKYYENVSNQADLLNFRQFRWYHIHDFFKVNCQDNPLIKEYLEFLSMNMMDNKTIGNIGNLEVYIEIYKHFISFEKILKDVLKSKDTFYLNSKFNFRNSTNINTGLKRFGLSLPINNKEEYNKSWTNLFIGFEFRTYGIYKLIWLWSDDNENITGKFKLTDNNIPLLNPHNGYRFEEILINGEQESDISEWFVNRLIKIQNLV